MLKRSFLTGLLVTVTATQAFAQNVPLRSLSKPDAEFAEPFTLIAGIRELKDGRVVAIDPRDKTVQVIDFRAGSSTRLGREGAGPGEYGMPMRLLPLPNDTSAVVDMLNNRILLINPNATVGGFVDLNTPQGGRGGGGGMIMIGGANSPTFADAKGRLYSEGSPIQMTGNGPVPADSVPVVRWDRSSGKRDTLAWRRLPRGSSSVRGGRGNMNVRIGGGPPFAGSDLAAVSADGRVAVVRHDPFVVEYVNESGQRTRGQPIRHDRVRVAEGHKQEWRERQRSALRLSIAVDNSGRRAATMGPGGPVQDPDTWGGDYLPPFLPVQNAASFSNEGFLWLLRTGPAGQPPAYDVIDRAGNVVQRVVLPARARLVGFGNNAVYIARVDQDDLQYLQKHRFTMPERP